MRAFISLVAVLSVTALSVFSQDTKDPFPRLSGPYLGQTPPGETAELFAPRIISTGHQHGSAYFSPDGRELVYSWTDFKNPPYIMHTKEIDGVWSEPQILVHDGLTPCFSPDGDRIFVSWKYSLAELHRTSTGWSAPTLLPDYINFQRRQDFPSISTDGTLYYSTMFGSADGVYFSREVDGAFGPPVRLEIKFRNKNVDAMVFVSPQQDYLILSSYAFDSQGMADLFICFKKPDGSWSYPRNMGSAVNTAAREQYPTVTPDGKYLFFMSTRRSDIPLVGSGAGNIYWISAGIIDKMKAEFSQK